MTTAPGWQRRDLLTGIFVLGSVGVILAALVITSGVLHRQYAVYMRVANPQDLTQDTRVLLQGSGSLDRADTVLAVLSPRVGPTADSLVAILGEARRALQRVDALADTAQSVVGEDRITLQETLRHLHNSALLLEHFADQVSRRPTRLLTGVKPPPLDTTRSQP